MKIFYLNKVSEQSKLLIISIGLVVALFLFQCQHARIRINPPIPSECKPLSSKGQTQDCLSKRTQWKEEWEKIPTSTKEYEQVYYYWGFSPNDIGYDLSVECPKGTYEIHQFSTLKQGIYEQVTLGFYSPRTIKITCLNQEFIPTSSGPARRKR